MIWLLFPFHFLENLLGISSLERLLTHKAIVGVILRCTIAEGANDGVNIFCNLLSTEQFISIRSI
jgi:hypothetical protein